MKDVYVLTTHVMNGTVTINTIEATTVYESRDEVPILKEVVNE